MSCGPPPYWPRWLALSWEPAHESRRTVTVRRWGYLRKAFFSAALVALVACGQLASSPTASVPKPKPFQPPTSWGLFASDSQTFQGPWRLTRLDAGSLKDAAVGVPGHGYPIASADGSTLVEIDYGSDQTATVHVIDARTGTQRVSFQPPFGAAPTLTPDGSRLLVMDSAGQSMQVFDTSNGRSTGKLENKADPCCGPFWLWLDPTGRFVYRVLVAGSGYNATGPVTPVFAKYDLQAGRETGRLTLDGVEAGVWQSGRVINSEPATTSLIPGVALSPDGSRLSVLYADGGELMTIDTAALKIVASHQVAEAPPPSNWFGLIPVDVSAKYDEGVAWNLAYSPDGRQLVAGASQTTLDKGGNYARHGLGIRVIDAQNGSLIAKVPDIDVGEFFYAPDSSTLYAIAAPTNAGPSTRQIALLRFDPSTLAVAARRDFVGPRAILVLALP